VKTDKGNSGGWAISIVTSTVVGTSAMGDSTVAINVYAAAGSNMKFTFPRERWSSDNVRAIYTGPHVPSSTPIAQAGETNVLNDIFAAGAFPPIAEARSWAESNICSGEEVTNLHTLAHRTRFLPVGTYIAQSWYSFVPSIWHRDTGMTTATEFYDFFAGYERIFKYRKGSYIWRFLQATNSIGTATMKMGSLWAGTVRLDSGVMRNPELTTNPFGLNGVTMESFEQKRSLEIRVPYVSQFPMVSTAFGFPDEIDQIGVAIFYEPFLAENIFLRVGMATSDDFAFAYPVGCPVEGFFAPIGTTQKQSPGRGSDTLVSDNNNVRRGGNLPS